MGLFNKMRLKDSKGQDPQVLKQSIIIRETFKDHIVITYCLILVPRPSYHHSITLKTVKA